MEDIAFAYSIEVANLIAKQLERFITVNPHQLVQHVENLDFWLGEAEHALRVIDGYRHRHEMMKRAFQDYIKQHATNAVQLTDWNEVGMDHDQRIQPPTRIADSDLKTARLRVVESTYRFLRRCFKSGMIDGVRFRESCQRVGTSIDPIDLR